MRKLHLAFITFLLTFSIELCAQPFNGFLALDRDSDFAFISGVTNIIPSGDFTLELFFSNCDTVNENGRLIDNLGSTAGTGMELDLLSNHSVQLSMNDDVGGNGRDTKIMGLNYIDGDWNHVAVTYDSANAIAYLYLNGALVDSMILEHFYAPGNRLYVGSKDHGGGGIYYGGGVDEIRISNIRRYEGMTYDLPEGEFSLDANTVGLWHFNELGAVNFVDETTNDYDLQAVGDAFIDTLKNNAGWDSFYFACDDEGELDLFELLGPEADIGGDWYDAETGELTVNDFYPSDVGVGVYGFVYQHYDTDDCLEDAAYVEVFVDVCSGLSEAKQAFFTVFPNPGQGDFTIQRTPGTAEMLAVAIYDLRGRLVEQLNATQNGNPGTRCEFFVSLAPGIYSLVVTDNAGRLHHQKLVIR